MAFCHKMLESSIDILIQGSSHSEIDPFLVTAMLLGCWPSNLGVAKHDARRQCIYLYQEIFP